MKLFYKIYSAVFICFVLIVMAMSAFIIRSQIANAIESMINQQRTVGSIMICEIEKGYLVDKLPFQSLKFLTEHESFAFWWLVKPNGEVYLADDIKSIGIQAFTHFPQASGSIGDNAVSIMGKNEIVFMQTFGYGSNKMSFWLGFTTKDIQLAKKRIISTTFTYALASLAVLSLMIYFVINRLIRPIQKLTVAAGKIGSGQFDCKVDKQSNDEIGLLADAFNKMAADLKQTTTSIDNLSLEISERKKAEEKTHHLNLQLENSIAKLEEVNSELKNLVFMTSHDLREPTRKISIFGIMLGKSLKGKLTKDEEENLGFMIEGAQLMNERARGLLDYTRIIMEPQMPEAVDLNEMVRQIKEFELPVMPDGKQVLIEVPRSLPSVEVGPMHLHQLMQNLITNGIKYQAKGNVPHITITSKPAAGGFVRIEVTDNGIGIAPECHQSIFAMFKRLHSRNEYEGIGIGLPVCKKIVERYGGKIGVISKPGKGSTFYFTLPQREKAVNKTKELQAINQYND